MDFWRVHDYYNIHIIFILILALVHHTSSITTNLTHASPLGRRDYFKCAFIFNNDSNAANKKTHIRRAYPPNIMKHVNRQERLQVLLALLGLFFSCFL